MGRADIWIAKKDGPELFCRFKGTDKSLRRFHELFVEAGYSASLQIAGGAYSPRQGISIDRQVVEECKTFGLTEVKNHEKWHRMTRGKGRMSYESLPIIEGSAFWAQKEGVPDGRLALVSEGSQRILASDDEKELEAAYATVLRNFPGCTMSPSSPSAKATALYICSNLSLYNFFCGAGARIAEQEGIPASGGQVLRRVARLTREALGKPTAKEAEEALLPYCETPCSFKSTVNPQPLVIPLPDRREWPDETIRKVIGEVSGYEEMLYRKAD